MATQDINQKMAKLEALILEMGHVIRVLDQESAYCRYWARDGNNKGLDYVPELEAFNRFYEKNNGSPALDNPANEIKVILHLEDGNIQQLHATVDLQYVVINVDDQGDEPIILGYPEKPDTVSSDLSLQDIDIELDQVEGYDTHPWKRK
jgi:hypothetical protein